MSTFTVSTKKDKKSVAVNTALTVKWDGISDEQLRAGYLAFMVVKIQGVWRNKGIPDKMEVFAKDYAPGTRHGGPVNVFDAVKSMSAEEKAKLLAELQKMSK